VTRQGSGFVVALRLVFVEDFLEFLLTVTDFGEVLDSRRRTLKSADSAAIGRDSDVG